MRSNLRIYEMPLLTPLSFSFRAVEEITALHCRRIAPQIFPYRITPCSLTSTYLPTLFSSGILTISLCSELGRLPCHLWNLFQASRPASVRDLSTLQYSRYSLLYLVRPVSSFEQ